MRAQSGLRLSLAVGVATALATTTVGASATTTAAATTGAAGPAPRTGVVQGAPAPDRDRSWVSAYTAAMQGPSTLGLSGLETISGTLQQSLLQQVVPPPETFSSETLRQVLYLHRGGDSVRIRLSNRFGTKAVTFPSVTVGLRRGDDGAAIRRGTLRDVTFGGSEQVRVPRGRTLLSDPVDLTVTAFDHLVVSTDVPGRTGAASAHGSSMETFYVAGEGRADDLGDGAYTERGVPVDGGGTNLVTHLASTLSTASYFVNQVQVRSGPDARTLVAFGDSITDGFLSSVNTDRRYPDVLARRLARNPGTSCLSVANQAISGGRVTGDGIGPSALKRFQTQALDQPNVAGVIFLQGINDLGTAILQDRPRTADEIIAAYRTLAAKARRADVPLWIGTLTPAGNLARPAPYGLYSTPTAVAARAEVNAWLRGEGARLFAGVIDFDSVIKDPLVPDWISTTAFDSGDNLHPNDAGYRAMANSVPVDELAELC